MRKGLKHQNNFRNCSPITTLLPILPTLFESSRNQLRQYNNSRIKEIAWYKMKIVQNEEMSSDQEGNLIDVNGDSEPEYGVMAIDVVQINNENF